MSAWGLATTALLLCYRVASPRRTHTHTHKKCFSLSLCVEERWHLNCHWGEGKVVSQGSRGQLLCRTVFEWLQNKSFRDEISCCCHAMACVFVRVTMQVCAYALDAIKMPPHIYNMFLLRVSLRRGRSHTAAFSFSPVERACMFTRGNIQTKLACTVTPLSLDVTASPM